MPVIVRQLARNRQIAEFGDISDFRYRRDQIDLLASKNISTEKKPAQIKDSHPIRRSLYIGSFDPPTNGHLWVIEKGAKMFDELVVGIGVNPKKNYTFLIEERKEMLDKIVAPFGNVVVKVLGTKLAARFATETKCDFILQGIRNLEDYEYQKASRHLNSNVAEQVDTVFVIPPHYLTETSSSLVKGLVGFDDWEPVVKNLVPLAVFEKLSEKNGHLKGQHV